MDNGQGHPPTSTDLALVGISPQIVVTPEDFAQNQARIALARKQIEDFDAHNKGGLQRFYEQEQELQRRVEQGRAAQRLLQQIQEARSTSQPANIANAEPSSSATYYPGPMVNAVPPQSAANIVEMTSPQMQSSNSGTHPQTFRPSSTSTAQPQRHFQHSQAPVSAPAHARYGQQARMQGWSQMVQQPQYKLPSQTHAQVHAGPSSWASQGGQPAPQSFHPPNPQPSAQPLQSMRTAYQAARTSATKNASQFQGTSSTLDNALGPSPRGAAPVTSQQPPNTAKSPVMPSTSNGGVSSFHNNPAASFHVISNMMKGLKQASVRYILALIFSKLSNEPLAQVVKNQLSQGISDHPTDELKRLNSISDNAVWRLRGLDRPTMVQVLRKISESHLMPAQSSGQTNQQASSSATASSSAPVQTAAHMLSEKAATVVQKPLYIPQGVPSGMSVFYTGSNRQHDQIRSESLPQSSSGESRAPKAVEVTIPEGPSIPPSTPPTQKNSTHSNQPPWTPDKADKSRLARDIMRSLGRPTTLPTTVQQSPSEDTPIHFKRKRTPETPEVLKKQKTVIDVDAEIVTPGALQHEREELLAQVSDLPRWSESVAGPSTVIPTEAEAVQDGVFGSSVYNGTHILNSTSDTFPGHLMDPVSGAESVASGPPSSKSSPAPPAFNPSSLPSASLLSVAELEQLEQLHSGSRISPADTEEDVPARIPANAEQPASSSSPARASASGPGASRDDVIEVMDSSEEEDNRTTLAASISRKRARLSPSEDEASATSEREREPLFLPSPSSSHGARDERLSQDVRAMDLDADAAGDGRFVLDTNLLAAVPEAEAEAAARRKAKGKGKARGLWDGDEDVQAAPPAPGSRKMITYRSHGSSNALVSKARTMDFVLIPPRPDWVKRWKAREVVSASEGASGVDELEDDDNVSLHEENLRKEAAEISFTRLRESRCLWQGCGAILNSRQSLQQHTALHASQEEQVCKWSSCIRRQQSRARLGKHLKWHVSNQLYCGYEDCDRTFDSSKLLLQHHTSFKHKDQPLRPAATCVKHDPDLRPLLPPLPAELPSYMIIPRRVAPHPMAKAEHEWMSARVLDGLSSSFSGHRVHAGAPARSSRRPALQEQIAVAQREGKNPQAAQEFLKRMRHEEYENIAGPSRPGRAPKRCADIPSTTVTWMCHEGLVIWPKIDGEDADEPDAEAKEEPHDAEQDLTPDGGEHAIASDDHHGDVLPVENQASEAVAWLDAALGAQLGEGAVNENDEQLHRGPEAEGERRSEPLWTSLSSNGSGGGEDEADGAAVESLL